MPNRTRLAVLMLVMTVAGCTNSNADPKPAFVDVVTATIPISGQPIAVVFGPDGAPWVVCGAGGSVVRVDPTTNVPGSPVTVQTGIAAASGLGGVWIGSGAGVLSRIDPVSRSLVATISTGTQANAVAVAFGSVWTTDYKANTLLRIDPSTNQIIAKIGVNSLPIAIVDGAGSLWVLSAIDGSIARVDPATNQVVGTVAPEHGRYDLAFLDGSLYTTGGSEGFSQGFVERIAPASLAVAARGQVTEFGYHVAAADGDLWVSLSSGTTVAKVDPNTLLTTASVPVGGKPQGLAVESGAVWVSVNNPDGLVRIATGR